MVFHTHANTHNHSTAFLYKAGSVQSEMIWKTYIAKKENDEEGKAKEMKGNERVCSAEKGESAAVMLQNKNNADQDKLSWSARRWEEGMERVVNPFIQKLAHIPPLFL